MSGPFASTLFLPWLRRGISTRIERVDAPGAVGAASTPDELVVTVSVNDGTLTGTTTVALLGPGDVGGLDPRAFTRTWPAPTSADAEHNYLPLVELRDPDLPWRYTPARATPSDRLTPWLCLVVLTDDEIVEQTAAGAGPDGLPVLGSITVRDSHCLPDLSTAWAWAHVQVSAAGTLQPAETIVLADQQPHRLTARLLCPRRLEPDRAYRAVVVPTFESGRLSGLGEPVVPGRPPLTPAWTAGQSRVRLPVYHQWSFRTGPGGDLEALVSRLAGRPAPASAGLVELDVADPGAGLPPASRTPLLMSGALRSPAAWAPSWDPGDRARWTTALEALLNAPADLARRTGERVVAPPVYGAASARTDRVDAQAPRWLRELALDPRARAAAGLGALVVAEQRQELLAGAWAQARAARQIDEELRFTELSHRASTRLFARHLATATTDQTLTVTAPLHSVLRTGDRSAAARLADSPIPDGATAGAWRRVNRPLGPVRRRAGGNGLPSVTTDGLLHRLNTRTITTGTGPAAPGQMATASRIVTAGRQGPAAQASPAARPDDALARSLAAADALLRPGARRPSPRRKVRLPEFRTSLAAAAEPGAAINRSVLRRLTTASGTRPGGTTLGTPVLEPVFRHAAAQALATVAPAWLLPAATQIPEETVCLLATERRFVEAFLVGFNHALVRELGWHGYPADPGGTPVRRFWPSAPTGAESAAGLEPADDIRAIADWAADAALGQNAPGGTGTSEPLVVLIRSELLQRYPDTQVYLARARLDPAAVQGAPGVRDVGTEERHPTFSGRLGSAVAYFGFDVTVDQLVGQHGSAIDPGWYVMVAQPPSDTRFGLDEGSPGVAPARAWRDLSWGHLASDDATLASLRHIDLNAPLPDTRLVQDPVSTVWHAERGLGATGATAATVAYALVRQPVRVGLHGSLLVSTGTATIAASAPAPGPSSGPPP